jgi:hypothetical protein
MSSIFSRVSSLNQYTARRPRVLMIFESDSRTSNSFFETQASAWGRCLVDSRQHWTQSLCHSRVDSCHWWDMLRRETVTLHIIVSCGEGDAVLIGNWPRCLAGHRAFYRFKLRKPHITIWNSRRSTRCDSHPLPGTPGRRYYRGDLGITSPALGAGAGIAFYCLPQVPEGSPTLTMFRRLARLRAEILVGTWALRRVSVCLR